MMTSSFKLHGKDPRAVSIAGYPMFFKGRRCYDLAPSMVLFKAWKAEAVSNEEYTERFYQETLSCLNPYDVFQDLGVDAILLCWCPPGQFCHRRLVAQWLEEALDISVCRRRSELPAGSCGGGRPGRRGPVVTEGLRRRQLARVKGYDRQVYDGYQKQ